jgi:TPR repeat protein
VGGTPISKFRGDFWEALRAHSDAWERSASNEEELLSLESDHSWAMMRRAAQLEDTDPPAAFKLYLEAVEAGSTWSLEKIGLHYWAGTGVAADAQMAKAYFQRAIDGGSWMATIYYARLLSDLGRHDECERALESSVASDFVPAYFWLAWFRFQRSKTTKVRREKVRPLIEYAAGRGHPEAKVMLARWMVRGKFGSRYIARGLRLTVRGAFRHEFLPTS